MRYRWIAVVGWTVWIFLTSMTVVTRRGLSRLVVAGSGGHVSGTGFMTFWSNAWWLIVKGYHVFEFALLVFLLLRAWPQRRALCVAGASLYAMSDEIHQVWVPHRGGKLSDVCIDMLGIGMVGWLTSGRLLPRPTVLTVVALAMALLFLLATHPFGSFDWVRSLLRAV